MKLTPKFRKSLFTGGGCAADRYRSDGKLLFAA